MQKRNRKYNKLIVNEDRIDRFERFQKGMNDVLEAKFKKGESRHMAKKKSREDYFESHGTMEGYTNSLVKEIFSDCTMNNYRQVAKEFAVWLANNTDFTDIAEVTKDIAERYLRYRIAIGLTAETVSRDLSAINKIFEFGVTKQSAGVPNRCKKNYTRSRMRVDNDKRDISKYTDQITFTKATGLRRASMLMLRPWMFKKNKDGILCAVTLKEKGGKIRIAPILNSYKQEITDLVAKYNRGKEKPLFDKYPKYIDNHAYRAEYARSLMFQLEKEKKLHNPYCEGDYDAMHSFKFSAKDQKIKGNLYRGHDKDIVGMVSAAMGHNRLCVVFDSYGVKKIKPPKNKNKPGGKKSMINFSKEQQEAIDITEGYQCILAAPGSGKTAVVVEKAAQLRKTKIGVYAFTHTTTAVDEMKKRISQTGLSDDDISTVHALCYLIVKDSWSTVSNSSSFEIIGAEKEKLITENISKFLPINGKNIPAANKFIRIAEEEKRKLSPEVYFKYFTCDKNDLIDKIKNEESVNRKIMLACFYEQKVLCGLFFHDLILLSMAILKNDVKVLEYWQDKLRYVIIDEFQDLSVDQFEIIDLLCEKHGNLCVVGDPNQSIFGWAGASHDIFNKYKWHHKNCAISRLSLNYRSTQAIVDLANAIIKSNTHEGQLFNYIMTAKKAGGSLPVYFKGLSPEKEAIWLALKIKNLIAKGVRPKDIAILVRTNNQTSRIENMLATNKIPYTKKTAEKSNNSKVFGIITAYLKMVTGRIDDEAFLQSINFPSRNFSISLRDKLEKYANENNCSLYEALGAFLENNKGGAKIKSYYELIEEFKNKSKFLPLSHLVSQIMSASGCMDKIKDSKKDYKMYTSIMQIMYDEQDEHSPEEYIDKIIENQADVCDSELDAVHIMTVHSAKGCEWDYVFVPGLIDDIYPLSIWNHRFLNRDTIEEERNVLYVAVTRAKKELYLSSYSNDENGHCAVSRFLKGIDQGVIKNITDVDRRCL